MIPQIMAQLHMVFGARILFDNHFNIAHFLKVIAYSVPLIGLTLEYIQTFIDEKLSRVGLEKARNELREANATLEIKVEERTTALAQANAEMLDDLKQGGVVQRGLMEVVATPDYQVDAVNRPYKGWVGGDGYSLLKSTNGDYWLRVSDGTGHGSSGGEAEIVDHLLFSNVIEQAHNSAEALNMMTTILHERFPNANLTYAYFLAHLTPTGRVDYVNARQLAFHIKKNKVEQLPSVPVIVGEIGDIEITKHQTLMLEADESLLIATDGIFEARYWNERNQKNSIVGKRAIKVRAHLSTQDIYKDITSFPNFVQADDILIVKLSKSSAAVEHSLRLMRDMSDEELETLQNSEITSQSWRKTQKAFLLKENNNTEAYYFADLGTETRDFLRKLLEYSEASKRLVRQTQGVISELLLNAQTHMEKPSYLCFTLAFRHDGSILLILVNSSSEENFEKARTYVLEALDAKAAGKTKLDELADKLLEQTSEGGIGLWNAVTQLNGDFWVTFDRKNSYLTSYCIIREK
jgi:serine phosphatase RsbU (regulator of sigma subunit)/anti-sigma regulatory factor (Ser/Thr protein kinase)